MLTNILLLLLVVFAFIISGELAVIYEKLSGTGEKMEEKADES